MVFHTEIYPFRACVPLPGYGLQLPGRLRPPYGIYMPFTRTAKDRRYLCETSIPQSMAARSRWLGQVSPQPPVESQKILSSRLVTIAPEQRQAAHWDYSLLTLGRNGHRYCAAAMGNGQPLGST